MEKVSGFVYTDANYAELLRFDKDQEVQKKWCSLKYELLRFTRSEAVHLATVRLNGYAIEYIKDPSEEVQLAAVRRNRDAIYYIKNPCPIAKRTTAKKVELISPHGELVIFDSLREAGKAIKSTSIYYLANGRVKSSNGWRLAPAKEA